LAKKAGKHTLSNPLVGAVLVYKDRIIGEGFHQKYGQAHAEVNALNDVKNEDRHLIPLATLYVSLEPCAHTGKTPPCAHRIVRERIPRVVIGCADPNPIVAGNGIQYLQDHGVEVTYPILEKDAQLLIAKFKANLKGLPYIILKWAQSADLYISKKDTQTWLSNEYTRVLTHQWRSEVDAIMVGKNTVLIDNPSLDVRNYFGESPVRIVLDSQLAINQKYKLIHDDFPTIIFNQLKNETDKNKRYIMVESLDEIETVLSKIYQLGITSVLIEGGAILLKSFVKSGLWHEARVIKTTSKLKDGIPAPMVDGILLEKKYLKSDEIIYLANPNQVSAHD
jgi:diaminohydroxyphosphoribosylaminopyrimidine deaminase/5-amino-6-(5-phosphoribosylamino)uracil reductase